MKAQRSNHPIQRTELHQNHPSEQKKSSPSTHSTLISIEDY